MKLLGIKNFRWTVKQENNFCNDDVKWCIWNMVTSVYVKINRGILYRDFYNIIKDMK